MNGTIRYTIRPYDTIWMLAQVFNTTVDSIMELNPGIDPRNLMIGHVLTLRPGYQYASIPPLPSEQSEMEGNMMNQNGMNQNGMNQRGMNQNGMNQRGMNQNGMNQGGMNQGGMNQGGMNQGGMNQGGMNQNGTNQGGMNQGGMNQNRMDRNMMDRNMMDRNMMDHDMMDHNMMDDMDGDIMDLRDYFRLLWDQHVEWTRMAVMGMVHNLPEADLITKRLLRNPEDFANALTPFYGDANAQKFNQLLTDHLIIATEIVKAAMANDSNAVTDADERWHANAEAIAAFLASLNPYWNEEDWSAMLMEHLDLLSEDVDQMISGDYEDSINGYDEMELQALEMADMMSEGIAMQYPD